MWFDVAAWDPGEHPWVKSWGVRSTVPGGPFYGFRTETAVRRICGALPAGSYCVSPMIDDVATVTLWANAHVDHCGLNVEYREHPPQGLTWREGMQNPVTTCGLQAAAVIRKHLNDNSHDDLRELLDTYPGHVVELTALDRCVGTVPHRNAVIWEVRGSY